MRLRKMLYRSSISIFALLVPSLVGIFAFYFIPAGISIIYAFIDLNDNFLWFRNFSEIMSSMAFGLAVTTDA